MITLLYEKKYTEKDKYRIYGDFSIRYKIFVYKLLIKEF